MQRVYHSTVTDVDELRERLITPNECVKERHPLSIANTRPIICHISETDT